jgi:predicted DNA binding CopG/RHH family protein
MEFDKEESGILRALDNNKLVLESPSIAELKAIKAAAENTFRKDRRVTLRLYEHDFQGIQKKAMEMGIPYQTLISGLIHQYVEGEL